MIAFLGIMSFLIMEIDKIAYKIWLKLIVIAMVVTFDVIACCMVKFNIPGRHR